MMCVVYFSLPSLPESPKRFRQRWEWKTTQKLTGSHHRIVPHPLSSTPCRRTGKKAVALKMGSPLRLAQRRPLARPWRHNGPRSARMLPRQFLEDSRVDLTKCWFNVAPAAATPAQHCSNIESVYRVFWDACRCRLYLYLTLSSRLTFIISGSTADPQNPLLRDSSMMHRWGWLKSLPAILRTQSHRDGLLVRDDLEYGVVHSEENNQRSTWTCWLLTL